MLNIGLAWLMLHDIGLMEDVNGYLQMVYGSNMIECITSSA